MCILLKQRCKPDVSKSVVTTMTFTIDDKQLVKWMWVKKIRGKTLAQDVFGGRWSLDVVKTLIKISVRVSEIFNSVDLCSGVGIVWSTTTRTRVSDVTAVSFSVKCCNPLKLNLLSGNIFRKWFASYFLFIHKHLIIMRSPKLNGKFYCCNDTFTGVQFTSLLAKNI